MQTFLPYPNFVASAIVLDRARLGKQRLEASQILSALHIGGGWANHPAVRMWTGHAPALALYLSVICREWTRRGYQSSAIEPFDLSGRRSDLFHAADLLPPVADDETIVMPKWLGDEEFHAAHRSKLLMKDPEWYGQFGWSEEPGREYVWPTP